MTGFDGFESMDRRTAVDGSQPRLSDLESVLRDCASPAAELAVARALQDAASPLAQLVDLLGSHELVPNVLIKVEPSQQRPVAALRDTSGEKASWSREQARPWMSRLSSNWLTVGGVGVVVFAAWLLLSIGRPLSPALAGVKQQLEVSQSRLDEALLLLDQEDYGEAEMALITLRTSLDGIRPGTREQVATRRRIEIRAWSLEAILLGQRGSFDAAEASLEQARRLSLDDRADRASAAWLAYALGKVEFQKSQRHGIDLAARREHMGYAQTRLLDALRIVMGYAASVPASRAKDSTPARADRLRGQLELLLQGTPIDERLAVRIAISLATAVHKSAAPATGTHDLDLAIWLYDQAGRLLERHTPATTDLTWELLRAQLAERRGLTLCAQNRKIEAVAGYEAAIQRLENRADPDSTKLDYQLGILHSNMADALLGTADRSREIAARSIALRYLERFHQVRPTMNALVNIRLNRARRALASFSESAPLTAIDDMIVYFAITPAFANDLQLSQLNPFEAARLYLIKAWHSARRQSPFEADVKWASDLLVADTRLDGLDHSARRAVMEPFLRLAELETSPAYRDLQGRWSKKENRTDSGNAAISADVE